MRGCGWPGPNGPHVLFLCESNWRFSFCVNQNGGPFADGFSFSRRGGGGGMTDILAAFVPADGKGPPQNGPGRPPAGGPPSASVGAAAPAVCSHRV